MIVGNAPTLAGGKLGRWIDSHDVVVRFNDCRVAGHEADVGARTDILVCNPYAETRPGRHLGGDVAPKAVIAIASLTRRGDKSVFDNWVGDFPVLLTYSPDIRIDCGDRRDIALTTGTYGLVLLERVLKPARLSVTGFTMFRPGSDFHYWSNEIPSGVRAHKPASEAAIFARILNALACKVTVTEEVRQIFETAELEPASHIRTYKARSWLPRPSK